MGLLEWSYGELCLSNRHTLPGMKLGVSHKTGQRWSLTSWLADDTPATGAFTLEWDPKGVQLVMRRQGMIYWNSGAIKRDSFGGGTFFDFVSSTSIYDLKNVTNEEEEYFTYSVNNEYDEQYRKGKSKLLLDYKGLLQDADRLQIINVEECYGYNTDDGCAKWEQPKCRGSNMKFETRSGGFTKPAGDYDMGVYDNNGSLSRSDCRAQCWNDCDCLGFRANGGTGCLFWRGKDLKFEQDYSGATVRLDLLVKSSSGGKKVSWKAAVIAISVLVPIFAILFYIGWKLKLQASMDTFLQGKSLNSSQTLVSSGRNYSLGFFSIDKNSISDKNKSYITTKTELMKVGLRQCVENQPILPGD
ncbi:hypothetical protein FEM48_Zijuj11G0130900 [Ziziphus jujuba var. spinosa]|uniref:Apple domain-containing protein n=1 Tax=Ziziphus jujuba var. spinosa TaxID=714518 RepID=A0A978UJ37_ZIZJJ|nr:hypothetical protein FEM48_Zijuj11G0130900 [Ziziphus jujuba var. spinosa]